MNSIIQESESADIVRPTRVQFRSNLPYDAMSNYLKNLKDKKLILRYNGITLTRKGEQFVKDYERIQKLINQIGVDYFSLT